MLQFLNPPLTTITKFFCIALCLSYAGAMTGQISITAVNTPYQQDFNTLASSGTSSALPTGWVLDEIGLGANTTYVADNGVATAGNTYSYGTTSSTERAFGELSGLVDATLGASFQNNTGVTITTLMIQYIGEQWRLGTSGVSDQLDFQYSLNATAVDDAGATWVNVNTLDFVSPTTIGTVGPLNGNLTANQSIEKAVIFSLSIPNGSTFWIRWLPNDIGGSDHGLAIDDFILSANPATHYTITTAGNNLIITDVFGNGEILDVALDGASIQFWALGRTYTLNGGPVNAMPALVPIGGLNSITINAGNGNDTINIGAFGSLPDLDINGGKDADIVNFNGDITFISNEDLKVNLQDDDANPGVDQVNFSSGTNVALSGLGFVEIKVSRNISFGTSSSLETVNGSLTLEANQQVTPTSGSFQGVSLASSSLIRVTGGGSLTVKGKGGDSGGTQSGIYLIGGDITAGTSGVCTIVGNGGASSGNTNCGFHIASSISALTTNGASLNITGTGGGASTSSGNRGLEISSGIISAGVNGAILISGTGGSNSTGGSNDGLRVFNGGDILTNNGNITINGSAGGSGGSTSNSGISITTNNATIQAGGSGNILIGANGGNATGINQYGFSMGSLSLVSTAGGNITIEAYGGPAATSGNAYGVVMTGGTIMAGGSGIVDVYGEGGGTTGNTNFGVNLSGSTALITSSGGNVSVTGQGGGSGTSTSNYGVNLILGSIITAGGNGDVIVEGFGSDASGTGQRGVNISDAMITSTNGHVIVSGTGGGSGTSYANNGVTVDIDGIIKPGGTGQTIVTGIGGNGTGSPGTNFGVRVSGAAMISSTGGNVDVTGTGGGDMGNGLQNYGVALFSAGSILAEGMGVVTVEGTGSDASGLNQHGVFVSGVGSAITSSGGDVNVIGYGGGSGGSEANHGVFVLSGEISAVGDGDLDIYGQGGAGTGGANYGVHIGPSAPVVTVASGNLSILGLEGTEANSYGIVTLSNATIESTAVGSAVILQSNSMSIGSPISALSGSFMQVFPALPDVQMELGTVGDTVGGPLRLSEVELDLLTAGLLSLGSAVAGDIVITANITRSSATNMLLTSSDDIILSGGSIHTAGGTLSVDPGNVPDAFKPLLVGTDATCSTFSLSGPLEISIDGPLPDINHTQLNLTGAINLTGSSLLITGTYTPSPGESFVIIENDGADPVTGTFTGLIEGGAIPQFLGGVYPATISYVGGTGNDVVITVSNPDYLILTTGSLMTVTDMAGNSDFLEIDDVGLGFQFNAAGRTYSYNGFAMTTMPAVISLAGIDSIQINMQAGDDVADFFMNGTNMPGLDVNGGIGNDAVFLGGSMSFPNGNGLHLDLQDDDAMPGIDRIEINNGATISLYGGSQCTFRASQNIYFGNAAFVLVENGDVLMEANQQVVPTGGSFYGFLMPSNAQLLTTGSGNITIRGKGGDTGNDQNGVYLYGGSTIQGGPTGNVIIEGTGGLSSGDHNRGVQVQSSSMITSSGGPVSVTGTGGGTGSGIFNYGVHLVSNGIISAGGNGLVMVQGTGGSTSGQRNVGVYVYNSGSRITSSGGNVTVIGQGGGSGFSIRNYGVYAEDLAMITAGGLGNVVVEGVAGLTSGERNYGVVLALSGSIQSSGGDIDVTGQGGGSDMSILNFGVYLTTSGMIRAMGNGDITIDGTGGPSSGDSNFGVYVITGLVLSDGGNIIVTGQGGGTGVAQFATGVVVANGGDIIAGGAGSVVVTGTGGLPTGIRNHGVHVLDAGSSITSSGGPVHVIGQAGGTGTSSYNHGVFVQSGGMITAGGTGDVLIEGTGGAAMGERNDGVICWLTGATITSAGGNVEVFGQGGGTGSSFRNYGVMLDKGGIITAGGMGAVSVHGFGGLSTGFRNYGVYGYLTGSLITSAGGDISVEGVGGGSGASGNNYGVVLEGADITGTGDAVITVDGTGGASGGNSNHGLYLAGGSPKITSDMGSIFLTGQGGGLDSSSNNYGLVSFGMIQAGGPGEIVMIGEGGLTIGNSNYGLVCSGTNSMTTTSGGNLTMTGVGGGVSTSSSNVGAFIENSALVRAGGTGLTMIEGTGGNTAGGSNMGVYLEGPVTLVTSLGGDVSITGAGGGQMGAGLHNYGVNIVSAATVTAGGSGNVLVDGTGGDSNGANNYGVLIWQSNTVVTSNGGNVTVLGQGGGIGAGGSNLGVQVQSSGTITAGGNGTVTVEGTGGPGSGASNYGILVWHSGTQITSGGGDVTLVGQGGGTDSSAGNIGVYVSSALVTSGAGAMTSVLGSGGLSLGATNYGVAINGSGEISSGGDSLLVQGLEGGGISGYAILVSNPGQISTEDFGGYILLEGNSMNIQGRVNTDTNTLDIVTIRPVSPGVSMLLGGVVDSIGGPLSLTDVELDSVQSHAITFGSTVTGDIIIQDTIDRSLHTKTLFLTNQHIVFDTGYYDALGSAVFLNNGVYPSTIQPYQYGQDVATDILHVQGDLEINIDGTAPDTLYSRLYANCTTVNLGTTNSLQISGTHTPMPGDSFVIVVNTGPNPIIGTFQGLPEGAAIPSFLGGSLPAIITYMGGDGNDVVIRIGDPDYIVTLAGNVLTVTDVKGNGDFMAVSHPAPGNDIRFNVTGRTFSFNGGLVTAMPFQTLLTPIDSIAMHLNNGNDVVNFSVFTIPFPSLSIDGGTGDETITFAGDITFEANANLDINLQDDDPTPGIDRVEFASNSELYLSGIGSTNIRVSRDISMSTGSRLQTQHGDIIVECNLQAIETQGPFFGVSIVGAVLQVTGNGDLIVSGKGGDTLSGQYGVAINLGGDIIGGTSGAVNVSGYGGGSDGQNNYGVFLSGAGVTISSSGADVIVNGTGGGLNTSGFNYGVFVHNAASISAGGTGTVRVNGQGGMTTGNGNVGVRVGLSSAAILSSGGSINIEGIAGGAGSSGSGYGVEISSTGRVLAGGMGSVTVEGTGGAGTNNSNVGVFVNGFSTFISSSGGDVSVTGFGGGTGGSSGNAGVFLGSGASITALGIGEVNVLGTGGMATGSTNHGVLVLSSGSLISSADGDVIVTGQGGGIGSGFNNHGVYLQSQGAVSASGLGNVFITGTGSPFASSGSNYGVSNNGGMISATNGAIQLFGTGGSGAGSAQVGLLMENGGSVIQGANGNVTLTGVSGSNSVSGSNMGVSIFSNAFISAVGGDVTVTGTSLASMGTTGNHGVSMVSGGYLEAGGNGDLIVAGTSASATGGNNWGVSIAGPVTNLSTQSGNLTVTGTSLGGGNQSSNFGVLIHSDAEISTLGDGLISIHGTGGPSTGSFNDGIRLQTNGMISSGGGEVECMGQAGGIGSSQFSRGVAVFTGTITSGGNGDVVVHGKGSPASGGANYSVGLFNNGAMISTSGGDISIMGEPGASSSALGIYTESNTLVTTPPSGGHVNMIANSMDLKGEVRTDSLGSVTLTSWSVDTAILLGQTLDIGSGPIHLSDTELDSIFTPLLIIGSDTAGQITVTSNITRMDTTHMRLVSNEDILISGGSINTQSGLLALDPGDAPSGTRPVLAGTDAAADTTTLFGPLSIVIDGVVPDVSYDQLNVTGHVDLNAVILSLEGTYVPVYADSFIIVNNDGVDPVIGVFFALPQSTIIPNFQGSGLDAVITYDGGDGNDVMIKVSQPDYLIETLPGQIIITDLTGHSDILTLSENGLNLRFSAPGRTYSLNYGTITGMPADVSLVNVDSITVNAALGNDQIVVQTFTQEMPGLTINGGVGNDQVHLNGDVNFQANANLRIDLQDDEPNPGEDLVDIANGANLLLAGSGHAVIKVSTSVTNFGGTLETDIGDILIEANQQPSPTPGNFNGVYILSGFFRVNGTGDLIVKGRAGDSNFSNQGVHVVTGGQILGGASGQVIVEGKSAPGALNCKGVRVAEPGSIITSAGGNVSVTGWSLGVGPGNVNVGVEVTNGGVISAADIGNLTVTGTGGPSTGISNHGVSVGTPGSLIQTNDGVLTINGTGGGTGSGGSCSGVVVLVGGSISSTGTGNVIVNGMGGLNDGLFNYGITTSGSNTGIFSTFGNISLTGIGGGSSASSTNYGIFITSSSTISAAGSGDITLNASGGQGSGGSCMGLRVNASGSMITTANGDITITGTGGGESAGNFNSGVHVLGGGQIQAGGTGLIQIIGMGGNTTGQGNYGVAVQNPNSSITASAGNISVTGTGGGTGGSIVGIGAYVEGGGQISTGGTGTINLTGTSSTASGTSSSGIFVSGSGTEIASANGSVLINGTSVATGSAGNCSGVNISNGAQILAGGVGQISISGTGANTTGTGNYGILLQTSNPVIQSSGGHVILEGIANGTGTSGICVGVQLLSGTILAGGAGEVHISGQGGNGTGSGNSGISMSGASTQITSAGGKVKMNGLEGTGSNGFGIHLQNQARVTTLLNGGNIFLTANSMALFSRVQSHPEDTVWVQPLADSVDIELGPFTDIGIGPLRLSDIELDSIFTRHLVIGDDTTGTIVTTAGITRMDTTHMHLQCAEDILIASGSIHTMGGNLLLDPGDSPAAVRPTHSGNDVSADTLSFASDLAFVIDGILPDIEHDQLNVAGHVDLTGVDLVYTGSYVPAPGDSLVLVLNDNTDTIIGTFTGLPEGDTIFNFMGSMLLGLVTYEGGDGNDMVIRITAPCQASLISSITVSPDTVCEGAMVTLTIVGGDLGGADTWQWYSQDCGVMPVDTGLSIDVNPTVTTTYYVRGEGGCAVNNTCEEATVIVNPYPDATIDHSFPTTCYYTDNTFQPEAAEIPGATYVWHFGVAATPATAMGYGPHVVQYTTPGPKVVKLVIHPNESGAQCPDSSTVNFTITNCPAQILGRVMSTTGDSIAGVNVRLFADANLDGVADNGTAIRSVFTPVSGSYAMAALTPGHYVIVETQPVGWTSIDDGDDTPDGDLVANTDSLDNIIPVSLLPLEVDSMNLFLETPSPGNITGVVFQDFDVDQMPDPGEGLPSVVIRLFTDMNTDGMADNGTPLDTVLTDANGIYMFSGIPVGHYVVVEAQPSGWINVKDFDPTNDGDLVPNTNMLNDTIPLSLNNGENDANNYFIDITGCSKIVTNLMDDGPGSLRGALDCAVNGDTITFHPALAGQTIVINSNVLVIDKDVVIMSTLMPTVTVSSQINGLIEIDPAAEVECRDFDIISGLSPGGTGAAFLNTGILTLHNMTILRNPLFMSGEYLIRNEGSGEIYVSGSCFIQMD